MMRRPLQIPLFSLGALLAGTGAVFLLVRGVGEVIESNRTLAIWEAPGSQSIVVEEADTLMLWHDYQGFFEGATRSEDPALPGGFSFVISPEGSSSTSPISPLRSRRTLESGTRSKVGIGTFKVPTPGSYVVTVSGDSGERRIVSLTQGGSFGSFKGLATAIGLSVVLAILAFIFLILAVVAIARRPKTSPTSPPTYGA